MLSDFWGPPLWGDYVGGPIKDAKNEGELLGPGGHTGYFSDPSIWQLLLPPDTTDTSMT